MYNNILFYRLKEKKDIVIRYALINEMHRKRRRWL